MSINRKIFALGLAAILALATSAQAIPTLMLSDGTVTVTITDGSLLDSNPLAGAVTYIGAVGENWYENVTTGQTIPLIGSQNVPQMDLSTVNNSNGAGTMRILFSETGFGPTTCVYQASLGGASSNPLDTVVFRAQADDPLTSIHGTGTSFSGDASSASVDLVYPYSLTETVIIRHVGRSLTSLNAGLIDNPTVPEPSVMLLLGAGFMGLGLVRRKRA